METHTLVTGVCLVGTLYYFRKKVMSVWYLLQKKAVSILSRKSLKQVVYVDKYELCEDIISKYFMHHRVLGLDCEWVTTGPSRGPVSLLQIASPDGVCALFKIPKLQCYNFEKQSLAIPQSLVKLLENSNIIKVGVAIDIDAKHLAHDYSVCMSSWLDLRHLAKDNDVLPKGLKYLAQETVGITLEKTFHIRVGDWDADHLTEEQILYAAMDAHAAMSIFTHFVARKQSLLRLLFPLSLNTYDLYIKSNYISRWLEKRYKYKPTSRRVQNQLSHIESRRNYSTLESNRSHESSRASREVAGTKEDAPWKGFRPGKVYDNCFLLDPQDDVLCTCERKKAEWYLKKNLGVLVRHFPLVVRLLFQPQPFNREDSKYYAAEKKNICVVCGETDTSTLVKKYIVPHEYRKYMPDYMKDRRSHDVLLMCYRCHKKSNIKDQIMRKTLAFECHAPLEDRKFDKSTISMNREIRRVKSAASALQRHQSTRQLPAARVCDLEDLLIDFYRDRPGCERWSLSECLAHATTQLCEAAETSNLEPHGKVVVRFFKDHSNLPELETRWREHFLRKMSPRFLPELWSLHPNRGEIHRKKARATQGTGYQLQSQASSSGNNSIYQFPNLGSS